MIMELNRKRETLRLGNIRQVTKKEAIMYTMLLMCVYNQNMQ